MPNMYRDENTYSYGGAFQVTIVKLIDGFLGQVMFGEDIVHQTPTLETAEEARKAATNATVAAVKRLFV